MAELKEYRRKISDEEAKGQFIFILKNALDFFPKAGKPFKLKVKGKDQTAEKTYDATINAVDCWCMGPQKPHQHYRIDARPFRNIFFLHFGRKVIIKKDSDEEFTLS